ncbi:DUF5060 domain-containing protein [Mariniflexile litorale]|uniref:DUF5060 domain-containing protein n=1 Tax=Mariniflexile litorale TaxID=3045158 RepID=A0AAU7EHL2_9FLAO|nr:DUF5060 domain-containing protein [Mariniflexile sp. KMM 9835]MDQ8211731.1 DUF5060 domain-containing protein [Mariniflexile sp. KMM 9835]
MEYLIKLSRLKLLRFTFSLVITVISTTGFSQTTNSKKANGNGNVTISGELRQWHNITLNLAGPFTNEADKVINPFTDYRFNVIFKHESGSPKYTVPGYFAADGNAAESGATSGEIWRAHLSPDRIGKWTYTILFVSGSGVAISDLSGKTVAPYHGVTGSFEIKPTDKSGRDFRGKGRLQYVGRHYLQFAGNGEYFLKAGPDSPETLLGSVDFDNTIARKKNVPLKTWTSHVKDWNNNDPVWHNNKGKGLIGALNYLASKGVNSISFLPYNAGGDGDNVWPFVERNDKFHYDCSKLDQWEIVFAHAQKLGLHLHFKLQETEIDDNRKRNGANIIDIPLKSGEIVAVPESLDGGKLGPERKLYLRELIARYGHHLALNWNLGEENTQTPEEQRAMALYIKETNPYNHNIVIHSYPNMQDRVYTPLLGNGSVLTGASLQNMWNETHAKTLQWVKASDLSGKAWVVANDEQGSANLGVPPDPNYDGFNGTAGEGNDAYDLNDVRRYTLWGNLMAGGAGVEYYFGYKLTQNDIIAEDFRSRDKSWEYCKIALDFFKDNNIPFWEMKNENELVGNFSADNSIYCFASKNELYLVYLPLGGKANLDMTLASGEFTLSWFNPRTGGSLSPETIIGGGQSVLLSAPSEKEDWLAVVKRKK